MTSASPPLPTTSGRRHDQSLCNFRVDRSGAFIWYQAGVVSESGILVDIVLTSEQHLPVAIPNVLAGALHYKPYQRRQSASNRYLAPCISCHMAETLVISSELDRVRRGSRATNRLSSLRVPIDSQTVLHHLADLTEYRRWIGPLALLSRLPWASL
ncbi:hypothetical protein BKA70DRAFT_643221 [Coprinopsis sp. MPI-PUGE-AT-0042]|nr:hypothetical protein BKA70DRAFT_643221 [Coprinopsis sp. MPI-PUGE-AT-0042]